MFTKLHRRQFLIARSATGLPDDWRQLPLGDGYRVFHDPDLCVTVRPDGEGSAVVLGIEVPVCRGAAHSNGHEADGPVSGRFVRIRFPFVETDASGLLAVFYRVVNGSAVLTSSPGIAASVYGAPLNARPVRSPGLNWQPTPAAPMVGWKRLFADQRFCLKTLSAVHTPKRLTSDVSEDQAVALLTEGMVGYFKTLSTRFERILVPLTAGMDSRTVFATLMGSGSKFEAVTQVFSPASRGDAVTAIEICKRFGVRHHLIESDTVNPKAAALLQAHQGHAVCDADVKTLFPGNFYRFLQPGDVMVRGGLFELGQRDYIGKFIDMSFDRPDELPALIAQRFGEPADTGLVEMLQEWVAYRHAHSLDLDFIDAFFFDHDIGSWLSAIEQGLDMLPGVSLHPKNSLPFLQWLMSTSPSRRRLGVIQKRVVSSIDTTLGNMPYNRQHGIRQWVKGLPIEMLLFRLRHQLRAMRSP